MESFFGILRYEMFYRFEKSYKSLDELEQAIRNYIITTTGESKQNEKDLVLCNTESNPCNNIMISPIFFGGTVHRYQLFGIRIQKKTDLAN